MQTLRIFISSPGDVHEERQRAKDVIQSLRRRYASRFTLLPVVWEDLPLEPDMSFQQGIDLFLRNPGIDVGIFILWSRLGSPLGATIRKADGSGYRSGTEREYDLMIEARAQTRNESGQARPRMIVYTRRDESSFDARLRGRTTAEKKEMLSQKELVESFMRETFNDFETGDNISAYHPFNGPISFTQRLRTHLQAVLDELAGDMDEVIWDVEKQGPPFLGLEAFQPCHAEIFFGREEEILEARNALKEKAANGCAFLLLSGASGSGKSSLARAGILPEILAHEPDEQAEVWKSIIVTPADLGLEPIMMFLRLLSDSSLLPELIDQVPSLEKHASDLAKDPANFYQYSFPKAIQAASSRLGGRVHFLIVLDQLEEIFTKDGLGKESRAAFLEFVETLARSGDFWVVATARSDFYEEIQGEASLVRMKEGRGLFDVLAPQTDAIARLIEEPARLAGIGFEERDDQKLSSRLLRDAVSHAELLPLLEFVLLELFDQINDRNQLTHLAYDNLGGVEGALRHKADSTYDELPEEVQASFGRVLQSLVTVGDESGVGGEVDKPVRLRALLSSFPEGTVARELITAFTEARLFTTDQAVGSPGATVTVAHESLLRVWPRAVAWKQENLDFLRTRSRIAARMKEGSPLLEGDPLYESARRFYESHAEGFSNQQRDWIRKSMAEAERKSRNLRRLKRVALVSMCVLTLVAVTGGVVAVGQRRVAQQQAEIAETESKRAEEEFYLSNFASAAESLKEPGGLMEGLRSLARVPVADREWEWELLSKKAGFAPIELDLNHLEVLNSGPLKGTGLYEAAQELANWKLEDARAQLGENFFVRGFSGGRAGGFLEMRRSPWEPVLAEYQTFPYGGIGSLWISPDESVVLFRSSPIRSEVHRLHQEEGMNGSGDFLYLVPLPKDRHFVSIKSVSESVSEVLEPDFKREDSDLVNDFTLKAMPNGVLMAGIIEEGRNLLIGDPGRLDGLRLETDRYSEVLDSEIIAAALSLDPQDRARAFIWLMELGELEEGNDPDDDPRPKRIHLDVDWTDSLLPVLSVTREGLISITNLIGLKTRFEIPVRDGKARGIWHAMTSMMGPGAFDGGGRFLSGGKKVLICPYQEDLAAIIDLESGEFQILGESQRKENEWWFFGANDWMARPGAPRWGVSPRNSYSWLRTVDSPSATHHFGIADNASGKVVFQRLETGLSEVGWTRDESLMAIRDFQRQQIVLKAGIDASVKKKIFSPSYQMDDPMLREIGGHPDRLMVGETLLRRSDLRPLVPFRGPVAIDPKGHWAAIRGKELKNREDGGWGNENFVEVSLVRGLGSDDREDLSDRVRKLQIQLLSKGLEDSFVTLEDGKWIEDECLNEGAFQIQPEWSSLAGFLRCPEKRLDAMIGEILKLKAEGDVADPGEESFVAAVHLLFGEVTRDADWERRVRALFGRTPLKESYLGEWSEWHSLLLAAAARGRLDLSERRNYWSGTPNVFTSLDLAKLKRGAIILGEDLSEAASLEDLEGGDFTGNLIAKAILCGDAWGRGDKESARAFLLPLVHPEFRMNGGSEKQGMILQFSTAAVERGEAPFWLALLPSEIRGQIQEAALEFEKAPGGIEGVLDLARKLAGQPRSILAGRMLALAIYEAQTLSPELRMEAAVLAGIEGVELVEKARGEIGNSRFGKMLELRSELSWPVAEMLEKGPSKVSREFFEWRKTREGWGESFFETRADLCAHFINGDHEAATDSFAKLVTMRPDLIWPGNLSSQGIMGREGEMVDFLRREWHAERASELAPGGGKDLHEILSRPLGEVGDTTKMIPGILAEIPDLPKSVLHLLLSSMLASGSSSEGVATAEGCLKLLPDEPATWFFGSLVETMKGEKERARELLERACLEDPRFADLSLISHFKMLNWEAQQIPKAFLELVTRTYAGWPLENYLDLATLVERIESEIERGAVEDALETLAELERRKAVPYEVLDLRSKIREKEGDLTGTLKLLKEAAVEALAVGAEMKASEFHQRAAELAMDGGESESALWHAGEALKLFPNESWSLKTRYDFARQKGTPEEIREALQALVKSRQVDVEDVLRLAWDETRAGRVAEALPVIKLALDLSGSSETREQCGWMFLLNESPREALRCFLGASTEGDDGKTMRTEGTLYGLAISTWSLGGKKEAIRIFKELILALPVDGEGTWNLRGELKSFEKVMTEIRAASESQE